MNETEIFAQIHKVIEEQMEMLKGKLTAYETREYSERKKRIDELFGLLTVDRYRIELGCLIPTTAGALHCLRYLTTWSS